MDISPQDDVAYRLLRFSSFRLSLFALSCDEYFGFESLFRFSLYIVVRAGNRSRDLRDRRRECSLGATEADGEEYPHLDVESIRVRSNERRY